MLYLNRKHFVQLPTSHVEKFPNCAVRWRGEVPNQSAVKGAPLAMSPLTPSVSPSRAAASNCFPSSTRDAYYKIIWNLVNGRLSYYSFHLPSRGKLRGTFFFLKGPWNHRGKSYKTWKNWRRNFIFVAVLHWGRERFMRFRFH